MSKAKLGMRVLVWVVVLVTCVAATWMGRGMYDRVFLLEGQVLVINATGEKHAIKLAVPVGEEVKLDLKGGASSRLLLGRTGEGSVAVNIDGTRKEEVGYVTSQNGMIIITVTEDRVIFSQVSQL
ncbi:MAG: hypothetical protein ACPGVU_14625 [Limisphaerales bacterium]